MIDHQKTNFNKTELLISILDIEKQLLIIRNLIREKIILETKTNYWGKDIDLLCELYVWIMASIGHLYNIFEKEKEFNNPINITDQESKILIAFFQNIIKCQNELKKNYNIALSFDSSSLN